ncbi:MAG TPA: hypothetical protein VMT72_02445 [Pseudolabrys sp.]|nr:hypothetical protein [Pseudolabrys sp.]
MKKLVSVLAVLMFAFPVCAQSTFYSNSTSVGIGTNVPTTGAALDLSYNTNSMLLPTGTSGQRPTGVAGMMRYNSAIPSVETYYSGSWNTFGTGTVTSIATNNGITGGTIVGSGTIGLAPIGTGQFLANPTGSNAVPVGTSLSAVIDNAACSTQGSILYRDGSSWVCLSPGTSGQVLQTQGASANPQWSAVTAGFTSCTTVSATSGGCGHSCGASTATCAGGYTMTGGGAASDTSGGGANSLQQSYPSSSNSWTCVSNSSVAYGCTAYAICCH